MLKGLAEKTEKAEIDEVASYLAEASRVCSSVQVTDADGRPMSPKTGFDWVAERAQSCNVKDNKMILIGNGCSAAIASHQATVFLKNGGVRALALNDVVAITALANDLGYANVFAEQLRLNGRNGDMLVAISSSGQSTNILKAVEVARTKDIAIVTFSGFRPDNLLRQQGDVNFWVDSNQYGFVEVAHHTLIQAILDLNVIPKRPAL